MEYDEETDSGAEQEHEMYVHKKSIDEEEEKRSYNLKRTRLHEEDEEAKGIAVSEHSSNQENKQPKEAVDQNLQITTQLKPNP